MGAGVVRVAWNAHQLVIGLSDGSLSLFREEPLAIRSTSSSIIKKPVQQSKSNDLVYADIDINAGVYAPETDPLYDEDFIDLGPILTRKRPDPIATKRPELPPLSGPGKGGKIGTSISQHILKHLIPDRSRGNILLFYCHRRRPKRSTSEICKDCRGRSEICHPCLYENTTKGNILKIGFQRSK